MMLNFFRKMINSLAKYLLQFSEYLSILLMVLLTLIILVNVILRYIFGMPFGWAEEIAQLLIVWAVCIAMGIALHKGMHIGIIIILQSLPHKLSHIIKRYSNFLILAALIIIVRDGLNLTIHSAIGILPASGISQIWLYLPVPIGCSFMIIYIIDDLLNGREDANIGRGK